jgi:hypothetical protein
MAQVDFSNAVLDVNDGLPLTYSNYLAINGTARFINNNDSITYSYPTVTKIYDTPSKVSILFTGSVTDGSGTSFVLRHPQLYNIWKVSNISFSSGDTYAFVIDIEVSGNT